MYRLIITALLVLFTASTMVQAQQKPAAPAPDRYVPDVMVLVFSGVLSIDTVSCTYNKANTSKNEAEQDVRTLETITQTKFNEVKVTSKPLDPSKEIQTSSEFQVNGFVDYSNGALVIEPFITSLKRFKNIEINFIINRKFAFKGLTDHDDKYVSVKLVNPYRYRITVKDPNFTTLNLPLVQPKQAETEKKQSRSGSGLNLLIALGIAVVAGVAVYFGARRFSRSHA